MQKGLLDSVGGIGAGVLGLLCLAAATQTPVVDADFDALLFEEEWVPVAALARVEVSDAGGFLLSITIQDSSIECGDSPPSRGTRLVLESVAWRSLARYSAHDIAIEARRDREGIRRAQPFVEGTFRLRTQTRTPPPAGQTFVVELDLDDVAATQSYARGLVTVRVCPW